MLKASAMQAMQISCKPFQPRSYVCTATTDNPCLSTVITKDAADLSITALGEMFERPGNYRVTVRRGDKMIEVTLTTRRLI